MILTAGVLCLTIPCSAMAAASNTKARYAAAQEPKALVPAQHVDTSAFTTMHFAILGRTATWDFTFSCSGYRCKFQNIHHTFSVEDGSYVAISAIFDSELSDIAGEEMMVPATGASQAALSRSADLCESCVTDGER
jgi:hypothetical protein